MKDKSKVYFDLLKNRNIKKREIRIVKRAKPTDKEVYEREINLTFGNVWGVNDRAVLFDDLRKEEDYKNTLRPCLILQTPDDFTDYSFVNLAPGTSKYHKSTDGQPCLIAKAEIEECKKDTYFLIYFRWNSLQKTVEKKFFELSPNSKSQLEKLLKSI